ncbi:MAG: hypothetical protein LBQ59_02595 [Candidatus Peribacteria bacterium]|jgi:hypothetical protein|nr:hypothetical protein [Candidatus Peribacteria bacterium]
MKDTILFSNELHTFLPEFVYIKYEEFPIYLSYKKITDTKNSSFTIVKLTPDEEKLVQNDGKVMDIDLTDKLIGKYTT